MNLWSKRTAGRRIMPQRNKRKTRKLKVGFVGLNGSKADSGSGHAQMPSGGSRGIDRPGI